MSAPSAPGLWPAVTLIVALTVLVFGRALVVGYISDDYAWLHESIAADNALFGGVRLVGSGRYYRPLVEISYRLTDRLAGTPAAHHALNLLLHAAAASALCALGAAVVRRRLTALALALVYLLHPLTVGVVYWISARGDLLATLGYLLALWGWHGWLVTGRRRGLVTTLTGLLCALLSKEIGVTLPLALTLLTWLWQQTGNHSPSDNTLPDHRQRRRWLLGSAALVLLYALAVGAAFYRGDSGPLTGDENVSLLRSAVEVVAAPLLLLLPNQEALLERLLRRAPVSVLAAAVPLALLGALLLWRRLRRRSAATRRLLLGVPALYGVTLLPLLVSGVNSRRMLLPLALLLLGLAFVLRAAAERQRTITHLLLGLTPLLMLLSVGQGSIWVENARRLAAYCDQLRPLLADVPTAAPIIFLTYPDRRWEVPLYANDLSASVNYCRTGQHVGHTPNIAGVGDIVIEPYARGDSYLSVTQADGSLQLRLTAPRTYFKLRAGFGVGQTFSSRWAEVALLAARPDGRINALAVTPLDSAAVYLLFDGQRFTRIEPPAPP